MIGNSDLGAGLGLNRKRFRSTPTGFGRSASSAGRCTDGASYSPPNSDYGTRDRWSDPAGAVATIASAFAPGPRNVTRRSGFDSSRNSPPS